MPCLTSLVSPSSPLSSHQPYACHTATRQTVLNPRTPLLCSRLAGTQPYYVTFSLTGSPIELCCYDASYRETINMQTPGTRTHRPHPHPRASAWIKTEAIRSCSQERTGAEIPQSPTHAPLKRTRADPGALAHSDPRLRGAVSARFAVQTQGQRKASLPGWRSGLLCSQPGSRLGLHVTRGSSCQCLELQHMGHGTARLCCQTAGETLSTQAGGSTQPGGARGRDPDPPPLPQIPLLPPPIPY